MATWQELLDEIYVLTNRSDLVAETGLALRQAVRIGHKSGKFWRDLQETTVPVLSAQVQEIDIPSYMPSFRAIALIRGETNDQIQFSPVGIDDLLDNDGYNRTNVYWGVGSKLMLRAATPELNYRVMYYKYPIVFPTAQFNSWIADQHADFLILWSAVNVLSSIGEQEIKSRLEPLAAVELAELQKSNIEIVGR
jgi:hypothetical protein